MMTIGDNGNTYYSMDDDVITEPGFYYNSRNCVGATASGATTWSMKATKQGNDLTIQESIMYILTLVGGFVMFLITLIGGFMWPFENHRENGQLISINYFKWVKVLLLWISYLSLTYCFSILNNITDSYVFLGDAAGFSSIMYIALLVLITPAALLTLYIGFVVSITDKELKKMIDRGIRGDLM